MNLPRKPISSRHAFWLLCALALAMPAAVFAPPPAWWAERGATNTNTADDYAAANIGQLKHFASKAAIEIARLRGGSAAIPEVNAMIAEWTIPAPAGVVRDDYAAVTLGQLKAVAKPFYDRLIEVGYTTVFPWTGSASPADDYAIANLGQLKRVFSFDLTLSTDPDSLPDWWERFYFWNLSADGSGDADGDGASDGAEFLRGTSPKDFFNGTPPVLIITNGDHQNGLPSAFLTQPLEVRLFNAEGRAAANQIVGFSVRAGTGALAATYNGSTTSARNVTTNLEGKAAVYLRLGAALNENQRVWAVFGGSSVEFIEHSLYNAGPPTFGDADGDGLTDYDEYYQYGTNPFVADTDGDGINDGIEVLQGRNPWNGAVPDTTAAVALKIFTPLE